MGKKPCVFSSGPPEPGEHHVDARSFSRTIQVKIRFQKGCGAKGRERFRTLVNDMADAICDWDARESDS